MGRKKKAATAKGGGVSKSQAIRDYVAKNPGDGPNAVSAALGKTGIKVSPAFVSTIKSTDKRKRKGGRRAGARRKVSIRRGAGGDVVSMGDLLRAKRLAEQMGGVANAKAALDALAKLVD